MGWRWVFFYDSGRVLSFWLSGNKKPIGWIVPSQSQELDTANQSCFWGEGRRFALPSGQDHGSSRRQAEEQTEQLGLHTGGNDVHEQHHDWSNHISLAAFAFPKLESFPHEDAA
jgi:hypothetical protein